MTIAVDTSALAAVVFGEDDAEAMLARMTAHAGDIRISTATRVEAGIVIEARHGRDGTADLDELLDTLAVRAVPLDEAQAHATIRAWRRFGKGRHPAALNLGDCYSYAVATCLDVPLLFKGNDFSRTDIRSVV